MSTCFAYRNPIFQPAMRIITAITNANPAQVTTSFAHLYASGIIVRLDIPPADGMQQANGLTGTITVTSPTTFTIDIDTTGMDIFAIPVSPSPQTNTCAMVVPVGEVNAILTQAVRNTLPHTS
jgi:hypothetical protein